MSSKRAPGILVALGLAVFAFSFLAVAAVPAAHATTPCTTSYTSTFNGQANTILVTVSGADGSCPSTYSNSGLVHFALSTSASQNPYTITLSSCSGPACPGGVPSEIQVLGWASPHQVVCNGDCGTGPWTFTVDATVQAGQSCNTAPIKVGTSTGVILEAGTGGDCGPGTSVPEFPLGLLAVFAIAIPGLLLIRSKIGRASLVPS